MLGKFLYKPPRVASDAHHKPADAARHHPQSAAKRDVRPVDTIVSAAAARIDAVHEAVAVIDAMVLGGVKCAWQLEHADAGDWEKFAHCPV